MQSGLFAMDLNCLLVAFQGGPGSRVVKKECCLHPNTQSFVMHAVSSVSRQHYLFINLPSMMIEPDLESKSGSLYFFKIHAWKLGQKSSAYGGTKRKQFHKELQPFSGAQFVQINVGTYSLRLAKRATALLLPSPGFFCPGRKCFTLRLKVSQGVLTLMECYFHGISLRNYIVKY